MSNTFRRCHNKRNISRYSDCNKHKRVFIHLCRKFNLDCIFEGMLIHADRTWNAKAIDPIYKRYSSNKQRQHQRLLLRRILKDQEISDEALFMLKKRVNWWDFSIF